MTRLLSDARAPRSLWERLNIGDSTFDRARWLRAVLAGLMELGGPVTKAPGAFLLELSRESDDERFLKLFETTFAVGTVATEIQDDLQALASWIYGRLDEILTIVSAQGLPAEGLLVRSMRCTLPETAQKIKSIILNGRIAEVL